MTKYFKGSQDNLEHFYMYKNKVQSVDAGLVARASNLRDLDSSENELEDSDLKFVANLIENSADRKTLSVDLTDNRFVNQALDDHFEGEAGIQRLENAIQESQNTEKSL